MTGIAGVIFPYQAHGSLIEKDGKVIGSELMGQVFHRQIATSMAAPQPRLAPIPATRARPASVPYNAANSMGSNLGPTNKALIDRWSRATSTS